MPARKLKEYLDQQNVDYAVTPHPLAFTAQEIAEVAGTPGKELAKTVIGTLDEKMAMVVLPASHQIDFELLKKASGARTAALATEDEFQAYFPEGESHDSAG